MTYYCFDESILSYDKDGFVRSMPIENCMSFPSENCYGETHVRFSRSGETASLKCDGCQQALDERLDDIAQRYPDSSFAPSWFDATYAGEHWDSDY